MTDKEKISDKAREIGFDLIGFAACELLDEAAKFSHEAAESGKFATLKYLESNIPQKRDPRLILPGAKSVIALAKHYSAAANYAPGTLKVARYALLPDYHVRLRPMLNELATYIKSETGGEVATSLDGGKAFEKIWAERAGLGFQGRNSLLITPEFGSYINLAVIFTVAEFSPDTPAKSLCGKCRKCIESCPNTAISPNKIIDLRRCISYHTIENKGEIPPEINLAGNAYGCDICQEVCPHNHHVIMENFSAVPEGGLSPKELLAMTPEEFNRKFADSPIKRIKLHRLKRNILHCLNQ